MMMVHTIVWLGACSRSVCFSRETLDHVSPVRWSSVPTRTPHFIVWHTGGIADSQSLCSFMQKLTGGGGAMETRDGVCSRNSFGLTLWNSGRLGILVGTGMLPVQHWLCGRRFVGGCAVLSMATVLRHKSRDIVSTLGEKRGRWT